MGLSAIYEEHVGQRLAVPHTSGPLSGALPKPVALPAGAQTLRSHQADPPSQTTTSQASTAPPAPESNAPLSPTAAPNLRGRILLLAALGIAIIVALSIAIFLIVRPPSSDAVPKGDAQAATAESQPGIQALARAAAPTVPAARGATSPSQNVDVPARDNAAITARSIAQNTRIAAAKIPAPSVGAASADPGARPAARPVPTRPSSARTRPAARADDDRKPAKAPADDVLEDLPASEEPALTAATEPDDEDPSPASEAPQRLPSAQAQLPEPEDEEPAPRSEEPETPEEEPEEEPEPEPAKKRPPRLF